MPECLKGVMMTNLTSDQIRNAVSALRDLRPAYKEILDFYERIFAAQIEAEARADIPSIQIQEDILGVKQKEQFPLIDISEFMVDYNVSEGLLTDICNIAKAANPDMAGSAKALINAVENEKIDLRKFFSAILNRDYSLFEQIKNDIGAKTEVLWFIAYNSLRPSLSLCAEQLSTYLDNDAVWEKNYCPICGNPPTMAALEDRGKRSLFCGFCWHKWTSPRIFCPFCGNREGETLRYFYSETETEYQTNICDKCGKYIKTVDIRNLERPFYPPLEQLATLHLDMKAGEELRK